MAVQLTHSSTRTDAAPVTRRIEGFGTALMNIWRGLREAWTEARELEREARRRYPFISF